MRSCGAATQTAPQGTLITQAGSAGVAHRNTRTTRIVHADSAETRAPSILAAFLGPDRHTGRQTHGPTSSGGVDDDSGALGKGTGCVWGGCIYLGLLFRLFEWGMDVATS